MFRPSCFEHTSERFKHDFHSAHSISQKIELFRTVNHDFYRESEPEVILSWFYSYVSTKEEATQIAQIFKARLGDTIICREASACLNRLNTIMDCIESDYDWKGHIGYELIANAFRSLNFKKSNADNCRILYRMYCDGYGETTRFIPKPHKRDRDDAHNERVSKPRV